MMDKFELYFKRADSDQDGRISGLEAVAFFKASGLPTPVLAQIWAYSDQNQTGYLSRAEFYNSLKLVTVSQSKRDLTPEIVKAALYGPNSAQIPAPQINLATLAAPHSNLNAGPPAQTRVSAPAASHSVGMSGPQGYPSQQTQHSVSHGLPGGHTTAGPRPSTSTLFNEWLNEKTGGPGPNISSQVPSNGLSSKPNGHTFSASGPGANGSTSSTSVLSSNGRAENASFNQSSEPWPKMTQTNVQKYTKVFVEVDTNKDGKITGDQARTLFLSWKLPRDILKQVMELSDQDNDSMLSLNEFCIALYLMERYREGRPLPSVLPAGAIFEGPPLPPSGQPPVAYGVQQGQVSNAAARPPRPVPVPVPINEDGQPKQKPRVPVLEKHLVDQVSTEEQNSLNLKFREATEADKKVGELEKDILEAKQKTEFYRNKMQELILYKSRCDSRLNEIIERVSTDRREVESLSKKYEDKYKQAGDVASKLTIEEATFRDIQEKKMELYRAIVKLDQGGKPDDIQARADHIQADLEDQIKALNERSKTYGLRAKPSFLVELPFGWQVGVQGGAADWDENWDKFEDEGFTYVKELTLDIENIIAPPKPKSLPVQNKSNFQDKSEKAPAVNESVEPHNVIKSPPESPSKIPKANSPDAMKAQSEPVFSDEKTFDEPDLSAKYHQDMSEETSHGNMLFDSSDNWGLNPIRTNNNTAVFDSVPSTPAYSYAGSPTGNNLFNNHGPFASSFDSVPSTPMFDGPEDRSFNNAPRDSFSRFDSFRSTAQDSESESNQGFYPRRNLARFDSMNSTTESDFGHSLFEPRESFSRFDYSDSNHGFPSFDDADGFGSHGSFKTSLESETPRKDLVDGWKAF